MALYAFDGTWNIDEIEEDRETNEEGVGTEACIPTWAADTVWGWAVSPCAGCCGEPRNAGFRLTRAAGPPCLLLRSCRRDLEEFRSLSGPRNGRFSPEIAFTSPSPRAARWAEWFIWTIRPE